MRKNYIKIMLFVLCLLNTANFARAQSKKINIIYIGDSITAGAGITDSAYYPPAIADKDLRKMGIEVAGSSNQGHGGYTTFDFMPNTDAFKQVEEAVDKLKNSSSQIVFSIMLGTNDSAIQGPHGSPLSKEQYYRNMKTIVDQLLKDFPGSIVVIHRPLWYSPNTYNGAMYLQAGLNRLKSYYKEIKHVVAWYNQMMPGKVYLGEKDAFGYFQKNYRTCLQPEEGHQGTFYLHPNKAGAIVLAKFWAEGIYKKVNRD